MSNKPILEPIMELLHMQRFVLLLCAGAGYLISLWLPTVLPWLSGQNAQNLGAAVAVGLGLASGALHLESLIETWKTLPPDWKSTANEIATDVVQQYSGVGANTTTGTLGGTLTALHADIPNASAPIQ